MVESIFGPQIDHGVRPGFKNDIYYYDSHRNISHSSFVLLIGGTYLALSGYKFAYLTSLKAFIPLCILPSSFSALSAGAFCIQFGVQGAWGVVRQFPFFSHHFSCMYQMLTAVKRMSDSHSSGGDVSTCIPSDFSWCCLSTR